MKFKFNLTKLMPTGKMWYEILFTTIAALAVHFVLDAIGVLRPIELLPWAYKIALIVAAAVYLKNIINVNFGKKEIF